MGEIGFFTNVEFELPGGTAANDVQPVTIYGIISRILHEKGIHKVNEEGHEVYSFNKRKFTISTLQDYSDSPSWTLNKIESTQSNSGGRITLSRIVERKVPYEMLECNFGRKYPALDAINIVQNIMNILESRYGGNDGC